VRNRAFFFAAFEGYRETFGVTVNGTVPTQQTRDRILAALPMPETVAVLDVTPLPTNRSTRTSDATVWHGRARAATTHGSARRT
jgi:hypothetical protein